MRSNNLDKKVQTGVAARAARQKAEAAKRADTLMRSYNVASGLTEALDELQNREGSKFTHTVDETSYGLDISTNVNISSPRHPLPPLTLRITVEPNGKVTAYGDVTNGSVYGQKKAVKTKHGQTDPIVDFVIKRATSNGLVN